MTVALFFNHCRRLGLYGIGLGLLCGLILSSPAQARPGNATDNAATAVSAETSAASLRVLCDTAAWIGDSLSLKLLYDGTDLQKVLFPIIDPLACPGLEFFSATPVYDTLFDKSSGLYTLRAAYPFAIYTAGNYAIPPVSIRVLEGADILIYETDTLWIHILEPDIDPNQAIRDIKDIRTVSFWERTGDFCRRNWLWLVLGFVVLAAAGFGWYYWQRRRKNLPVFSAPEPVIPPLERALTQLKQLKEKQLWQQNRLKEYYTELTDILRVFLDGQAHIAAVEMTSDECMAALRQHYPERKEEIRRLATVFRTADLVKFAKGVPPAAEHPECYRLVWQFIASHQTTVTDTAQAGMDTAGNGNKVTEPADKLTPASEPAPLTPQNRNDDELA